MRGHGQDPTGINAGTRRARALIAQADQCMAKADQANGTRLQGGVAASRTPDQSGGDPVSYTHLTLPTSDLV